MAPRATTAVTSLTSYAAEVGAAVRLFGVRGWLFALAGGLATLVVIGIPAAVVDNPFFARPLEVRTQDYVFWGATAALAGLIAGTFAPPLSSEASGQALTGGFLSYVAVGCPVCNKFVVALLGTSGALSLFAPAQFFIGLVSVGLLGWTLRLRARAVTGGCSLEPQPLDDDIVARSSAD